VEGNTESFKGKERQREKSLRKLREETVEAESKSGHGGVSLWGKK